MEGYISVRPDLFGHDENRRAVLLILCHFSRTGTSIVTSGIVKMRGINDIRRKFEYDGESVETVFFSQKVSNKNAEKKKRLSK